MIASVWRPDSTRSTTFTCTPLKAEKPKVECRMEIESTATYNLPFPEQMVTPTGIEPVFQPCEGRVLTARRRGRAMRSSDSIVAVMRSDESRVGKECASKCRSRWSPCHTKKKNIE